MSKARSFGLVCGKSPRLLILGSMPGEASLRAGEYYAYPRNSFWRIIADIFAGGRRLPYKERLRLLTKNKIALWDVLRSCRRPGSADSAIDMRSARANDFGRLFREHPGISLILFNGSKAEECYARYARPGLSPEQRAIKSRRLPSTSPAHAGLSYAGKLAAWSAALIWDRSPVHK